MPTLAVVWTTLIIWGGMTGPIGILAISNGPWILPICLKTGQYGYFSISSSGQSSGRER